MRTAERPVDFVSAVGVALAALGVRALLQPWLGTLQPFAPGFVAIAASVLFFGWRPAVLTAIVCYAGGTYLFVQPHENPLSLRLQDIAALVTYGLSSGLIIFIGHRARRAEQNLARANEQLRATDRKKDEFLATLSHELRNPVGVITTAIANLEARVHDQPTRATLGVLSRQAAQIRRLVDDLLDVGRISRGRLALRPARTDLRSAVEHAVESSRDAAGRKRQSLAVSVPPHPVDMHVDQARMVQVLSNLIDNATKYSPEGAAISVAIHDGAYVRLEVTDDGPGIDPDMLPNVFDLFDQSGASSSGGLGLGLGLCKRIVEMHGGRIEALPNPRGNGSSFVISLPKLTALPEPQEQRAGMHDVRAAR
jgi:signal transduction histidine kinase